MEDIRNTEPVNIHCNYNSNILGLSHDLPNNVMNVIKEHRTPLQNTCNPLNLNNSNEENLLKRKSIRDISVSPPKKLREEEIATENQSYNNVATNSTVQAISIDSNKENCEMSETIPIPAEGSNSPERLLRDINLSPSKFGINQDDIEKEKEKVKKRRSSFGRSLLIRSAERISNFQARMGTIPVESCENISEKASQQTKQITAACNTDVQTNMQNANVSSQLSEPPKVTTGSSKCLAFKKKTAILENEYNLWNNLLGARRARVVEAKREYKAAKNGEVVIEEDEILPSLSKDLKSLIIAMPDYEQYLLEIRKAQEELLLTRQKVAEVAHLHQSLLHFSKLSCDAFYTILENEILGELKSKSTKDLLKDLQNS